MEVFQSSTVRPLFYTPSFSELLVAEPLPAKSTCRSRCHPSGYGINIVPFNCIYILFECTSITTWWWRGKCVPPCLGSSHGEDLRSEQGSRRHQAPACSGVGVVSMFNQWEAVSVCVERLVELCQVKQHQSQLRAASRGTGSWDGAMERERTQSKGPKPGWGSKKPK